MRALLLVPAAALLLASASTAAPKTGAVIKKGLLEAVGILFSSNDVTTQRQRVLDYEKAMGRVSAANKSDLESRIFWALAIAQAASPTDKTYARQLQAAEMLEPLFNRPSCRLLRPLKTFFLSAV